MKRLSISGILFFLCLTFGAVSQEVQNMRISQSGNRVNILFDLRGTGKVSKVDLFYTLDEGVTWTGPLKQVSGKTTNLPVPSADNLIIWDAQSEKGSFTGNIQFKLEMDVIPAEETKVTATLNQYQRHKTMTNVWLTATLISAGTGLYATSRGNKLYKDYQNAGADAAEIHRKIETLDLVAPIAYGIAGICTINFIIQAGKQAKSNKQLSFQPLYFPHGGGAALTLNF